MLLKEIIVFKNGKKKPSSEGSIPIYGGNGILGYTDQNNQDGESLIIGRVGAYCGCVYSHYGKCWISDNAIVGKVKDGNDFYYCYYLLKRLNLNSRHIGSGQPLMTQDILNNIEINICDYEIQRKIGKILKNIDDKIALNDKINNNLHELIRSMYDELVSNADWDEVELSQVASVSSGKRPTTKNETGEYPIIGANGIMAYTNEFNMNSDLIITGRVGTLGVVKRYYKPIWASDNTLIVNTKYLNYIESYLKTIDYNSLNRGSTQPLLTQGDLNKQTLLFSENEVLEFESKVTPIVNKIRFNEEQNEILRQLRDTLLPKLMNGEIALDNIEI